MTRFWRAYFTVEHILTVAVNYRRVRNWKATHGVKYFSSVLERFANWFQSDAGVIQSFVVSTGGAVLELIFPSLDPNHFWYLFICTYWSAFTCNALANSSKRNAEHDALVLAVALKAIKDEEDQVLAGLVKEQT